MRFTYRGSKPLFDRSLTEKTLEALDERLVRVEAAIHAIEARLAIETPAPAVQLPPPEPEVQSMDMALIGKSVLVIGGAYVLRALTELHVLGPITGVILALVYTLFWIWAADRDLSRGLRVVALFHAGTAALIAGPLLWESTTRFHLLPPSVAVGLVLCVSSGLLAIALHQRSTTMALISAILATMTSIGIAIGTTALAAPVIAMTALGVALAWLSLRSHWPMYVTLIPAAASDLLVVPLVVMCAMGKLPYGVMKVEIALVAFVVAWVITPATWIRGQAVVATMLGLSGAAFLAAFQNGHPRAVGAACLTIAAAAYVACALRHSIALLIAGAIAALMGSLLVLTPLALTIAWAIGAAVSAAIGRRTSWIPLHVHAALWSATAAIVAGLPMLFARALFSPVATPEESRLPLIVAGALAAITLWLTDAGARRSRLVLLAIFGATVIALALADASAMSNRAMLATVRTGALAVAAVALSLLSRKVPEAQTLAWVVLILGGAKLLAQDLAIGNATTLVVALALYGGAIVLVAHRRERAPVAASV